MTASEKGEQPRLLVLYYSRSGNTESMATAVAAGAAETGASIDLVKVEEANVVQLLDYDGILIGSPTYYGQAAGELKEFFDQSVRFHGKLTGKVGGAFSSCEASGGGVETTILSLIHVLLVHGMIIQGQAEGGHHYGVASTGAPDEDTLEQCRLLGKRTALLAARLI